VTQFFIGDRASGKSTAAMRWLRGSPHRYLVVPDSRQVENIKALDYRFSAEHGVTPAFRHTMLDRVIPYATLTRGRLHGVPAAELGVDNLDMLLTQLFHYPVNLVTATGDQYSGPSPQQHNYAEGI
jgi:GTPase SAR1 family protein